MNPQGCGPNCQSEPTVVRSPGGWALEDYLPELRRRTFCAQEGPKHTDLGGCAGAAASADRVPGYWSGKAHRQRMLTEVSTFGDEKRRQSTSTVVNVLRRFLGQGRRQNLRARRRRHASDTPPRVDQSEPSGMPDGPGSELTGVSSLTGRSWRTTS